MRQIPHWVANQHRLGGTASPVFNPSTGEVQAEVGLADASLVDTVIQTAVDASQEWMQRPLSDRSRIMFSFRELLASRVEQVAACIASEHGKVLADAAGEVSRGLEVLDFACGIPHLLKGTHSEQVSRGVDVTSIRQPLGVVAGVTPFNFPVMVPLWMAPIAVACGNAFILKPSERDPSASVLLGEYWAEAGLPPGVFNVLHGNHEAVHQLIDDPRVRAVSFVGSTPIAASVYERAAIAGKRVQALGGAKNHMLVLPDADLAAAADAAVSAGFGSAGERCMAISVVVAHAAIADELVAAIQTRTQALKVATSTAAGADMGPLITQAHRDRVRGFIDSGVGEGASLVVDGRAWPDMPRTGFFLGPSLFDHVAPAMSIYTEEIFGPVLCVVRVGDLDEGIELINRNPYANGVAIFTSGGAAAREFTRRIDAGMVGINVSIPVPVAYHSFGGNKASLFGDVHVHGTEGVAFYTRGKVVTSRWGDPRQSGPDLHFPST